MIVTEVPNFSEIKDSLNSENTNFSISEFIINDVEEVIK